VEQKLRVKPKRPNAFYFRKIGKAGGTRTLSVGQILPPDWMVVKVTIEKLEGDECILKVKKLV